MNVNANTEDSHLADTYGDELPAGTKLLQGQYTITRYLNAGGFGITYLAKDSLDRTVVIKECFPSSMCCRRQRSVRVRSHSHSRDFDSIVRFFGQEARALAKLEHPNIVGVHQVFEDNHTSYMALDFVEGRDMLDVIDSDPDRLGPVEIREMLIKLLDAVSYVHDRGLLHRDIAPDNILLDAEDNPILIDFGAAREEASRVSRMVTQHATVKDGYSPQEFYVSGSKQTPASDLYALAATFYHLITGEVPPIAQMRLSAAAEGSPDPYKKLGGQDIGFDEHFLVAIDKCLELFPKNRIETARDWHAAIESGQSLDGAPKSTGSRPGHVQSGDVKLGDIQSAIQKLVVETNKAVAKGKTPAPKKQTAAAPPNPMEKKRQERWEKFRELNPDFREEVTIVAKIHGEAPIPAENHDEMAVSGASSAIAKQHLETETNSADQLRDAAIGHGKAPEGQEPETLNGAVSGRPARKKRNFISRILGGGESQVAQNAPENTGL
jgi:non-specific serine/threonine protein kinase